VPLLSLIAFCFCRRHCSVTALAVHLHFLIAGALAVHVRFLITGTFLHFDAGLAAFSPSHLASADVAPIPVKSAAPSSIAASLNVFIIDSLSVILQAL